MRLKPILTLAIAAMVLSVVGIGNAFAYSYSGSDYSTLSNTNYASWNNYCTGNPSANRGDTLTWPNTFVCTLSTGYYPTLKISKQDGSDYSTITSSTSLKNGASWSPDGSYRVPSTDNSGWHCLSVRHWYGTSQGSCQLYATNPNRVYQDYTVN